MCALVFSSTFRLNLNENKYHGLKMTIIYIYFYNDAPLALKKRNLVFSHCDDLREMRGRLMMTAHLA